MKRSARILAAALTMALVMAACGSDEEPVDAGAQTDETTADESDAAMEDEAMEESDAAMEEDEAMADSDEAMEDEAMEDEAMEEEHAVAPTVLGLEIVSIDFDTAEVVIVNNGSDEVTLDGYYMCSFPEYAALSGVGTVAPGESVTVTSPVGVSAAAGELGLYTVDSFSSTEAIQAYVEWGSPGHERSTVAIEAGIWDGTPLTVEGNTLTVG